MIDLSVIVPSIRVSRLNNLYDSLLESFSGEFEFIIIGPYRPPIYGQRIKWIEDWGTPVRCQQIGLLNAQGAYITRAVDDGIYVTNALDMAVGKLEDMRIDDQGKRINNVILLKHTETNASVDRTHKDFQDMNDPKFYDLSYHTQTCKPYVPSHYKIINFGLMHTSFLKEVGGWDCQFESVAIAELDLSIRLQLYGAEVHLSGNIAINCDWMPGHEGDHGPMHDCFEPDMAKYSEIYSKPSCEDRVVIDINNWRMSPERWVRRFGA